MTLRCQQQEGAPAGSQETWESGEGQFFSMGDTKSCAVGRRRRKDASMPKSKSFTVWLKTHAD